MSGPAEGERQSRSITGDRPPLPRIVSLLFCPATRPDRAIKLPATGADVGVIDLEDAVAPSGKKSARDGAWKAARALAETNPSFPFVIRVNPPGSEWFDEDVRMLAGLRPAGVVLPKLERSSHVTVLRRRLEEVGHRGLPVIAGVETARGVTQLERILAECEVQAVYFGAEDLIADLHGIRTDEGLEVLYARSHVALQARTAGIGCIDQVVVRLDDDGLFQRDARMGRSLGYMGKICLHPRQVPLARRAFQPSVAELETATRLLAAYDAEARTGAGAILLDGEMVDEPMVRRARELLSREGAEEGESSDG